MRLTLLFARFFHYITSTEKTVNHRLNVLLFSLPLFIFAFSYVSAVAAPTWGMPPSSIALEATTPHNVAVSRDGRYAIIIETEGYRLWKMALSKTGKKRFSLFADNLPAKPISIIETENGYRVLGPMRSEISHWILGPGLQSQPIMAIDIDHKGRFLRARRYVPDTSSTITQSR